MTRRLSISTPPRNSYPHPQYDMAVMRLIIKAIRRAWIPIALEEHHASVGQERDEVPLNSAMAEELDALRRSRNLPGFSSDLFETVVVDAPVKDYLGNRISSRPDITLRLRDIRPGVANHWVDAIYIECKRIRQSSNIGNYFSSGMKKFLDGQYAWAVQQAIMIGYVETSQELPDALHDRLCRLDMPKTAQLVPYKNKLVRPSGKPYAAFTTHHRTWKHENDDLPGDIELTHVWLWYTD